MKKLAFTMMTIALLALAGCNDFPEAEKKLGKGTANSAIEKEYKTGENVIDSEHAYVYGGIMGDAVVLDYIYKAGGTVSYSYPLYIQQSAKKVALKGGYTIEVKEIEIATNQATLVVTKKAK